MATPAGPGDEGTTKWNWVLYDIPATATGLAKNTTGVGTLGIGHTGTAAYEPPCSQGSGAVLARWVFRLTDGTCVVGASTDLAISDYNLVPMP